MASKKRTKKFTIAIRCLRKLVIFIRCPFVSLPSFLIGWAVFAFEVPDALEKWSVPILVGLSVNLLVSTCDTAIRIANWITPLQERLQTQLERSIEKTRYLAVLINKLLGE